MFHFTIRDILWLTVVVAMSAGWWVDHRRQAAEIGELKEPVAGFDIRAIEEMRADPWLVSFVRHARPKSGR